MNQNNNTSTKSPYNTTAKISYLTSIRICNPINFIKKIPMHLAELMRMKDRKELKMKIMVK